MTGKEKDFHWFLNEFANHRAKAAADAKDMMAAILKEFPSIKKIVVQGQTPAWNDGEACLHSEEFTIFSEDGIYSSGYKFELNEGNSDSPVNGFCYGEEHVDISIPESVSRKFLSSKSFPEVSKLLKGQALTTIGWGTDFVLEFELEGNELKFLHTECWEAY